MKSMSRQSELRHLVTVIIPIYTLDLTAIDRLSLRQCFDVLGHHDIAVIKPKSLDVSPLSAMLSRNTSFRVEEFDDAYFKGRVGYNRLLLSAELYERFSDSKYIFIHQTDVYVFRDELAEWCNRGYDYIGAPWLPAPGDVTGWNLPRRGFYQLRRLFGKISPGFHTINLKYRVGNGGCSLRHTRHFLNAIENLPEYFAAASADSGRNENFEDVVWSVRVNEWMPGTLFVAPYDKAVQFSVESHPTMAMRLTDGNLPMATHAFARSRNRSFWSKHIAELGR